MTVTVKAFKADKRGTLKAIFGLLSATFAFVHLSFIGCASRTEVMNQQSPEFEVDKTRKQSVVLFRLSAEIDGKPIDMLREFNTDFRAGFNRQIHIRFCGPQVI